MSTPRVLSLSLLLAACGSELPEQPRDLPLDEVRRIDLRGSQVRVEVERSELLVVDTETRWRGRRSQPDVQHAVENGVLTIGSACPEGSGLCEVTHFLSVPDDVMVDLDVDRGDVFVQDIAQLTLSQNHGDADLVGLTGTATLDLFEGSLTGADLKTELLQVHTNGGAQLSFADAGSLVDIDAGQTVLLEVPSGPYQLDLLARIGNVAVDGVFHTDEADSILDVRVEAGQILVRGQ